MTPHTPDWTDTAFAWAIASAIAALVFVVFCLAGCVTRTTVCVETAHGLGVRDAYGGRPDTVGGSACVDIERP